MQQRERKNIYLIEDYSGSEGEDQHDSAHENELRVHKADRRRVRRFKRRESRESRGGINIFAARKRVLLEAKKTPLQRDNAKRMSNLGHGGCQACMTKPCSHTPVLNLEVRKLSTLGKSCGFEVHFPAPVPLTCVFASLH